MKIYEIWHRTLHYLAHMVDYSPLPKRPPLGAVSPGGMKLASLTSVPSIIWFWPVMSESHGIQILNKYKSYMWRHNFCSRGTKCSIIFRENPPQV